MFFRLWRPDLALALLGLLALYAALQHRRRAAGAPPEPPYAGLWLTLGLGTIYLAQGTPLDYLGEHYLFMLHMVQHFLLTMVAPPLLLLGLPAWLLRPLFAVRAVRAAARVFLHPLVTVLLFNLLFSLYHVPSLYQAGLGNPPVHLAEHALLILTSLMLWWPVTAPLREQRLSDGLQMLYIFVMSVGQLAVYALITFADSVIYPWYEQAPRISWISAKQDQIYAGIIMNMGTMVVCAVAILLIFARWARREEAESPQVPPA